MMKNKLDYEAAKKRLKEEERVMRVRKRLLRKATEKEDQQVMQDAVRKTRDTINLLLSVIHAHKSARKLFGELRAKR